VSLTAVDDHSLQVVSPLDSVVTGVADMSKVLRTSELPESSSTLHTETSPMIMLLFVCRHLPRSVKLLALSVFQRRVNAHRPVGTATSRAGEGQWAEEVWLHSCSRLECLSLLIALVVARCRKSILTTTLAPWSAPVSRTILSVVAKVTAVDLSYVKKEDDGCCEAQSAGVTKTARLEERLLSLPG